jgi:hypothetical protein
MILEPGREGPALPTEAEAAEPSFASFVEVGRRLMDNYTETWGSWLALRPDEALHTFTLRAAAGFQPQLPPDSAGVTLGPEYPGCLAALSRLSMATFDKITAGPNRMVVEGLRHALTHATESQEFSQLGGDAIVSAYGVRLIPSFSSEHEDSDCQHVFFALAGLLMREQADTHAVGRACLQNGFLTSCAAVICGLCSTCSANTPEASSLWGVVKQCSLYAKSLKSFNVDAAYATLGAMKSLLDDMMPLPDELDEDTTEKLEPVLYLLYSIEEPTPDGRHQKFSDLLFSSDDYYKECSKVSAKIRDDPRYKHAWVNLVTGLMLELPNLYIPGDDNVDGNDDDH